MLNVLNVVESAWLVNTYVKTMKLSQKTKLQCVCDRGQISTFLLESWRVAGKSVVKMNLSFKSVIATINDVAYAQRIDTTQIVQITVSCVANASQRITNLLDFINV